MNCLKKIQYVIILFLVCIILPLFASEPNEPNKPKPELKFKINKDVFYSWYNNHATEKGRGPVKPSYVAVVFISESSRDYILPDYGVVVQMLKTSAASKFSDKQREFLKTSSAIVWRGSEEMLNYATYYLYAVSEEDAKIMALAIAEILNNRVYKLRESYEKEIILVEQRYTQAKKELPQKEAEYKTIDQEYDSIKELTHQLASDTEAVDLAKKSIIEMNKELNGIEIELAGVEEKLKSIEKYRNDPISKKPEVFTKLDVMYVELIIELSGIKAKKEMTEKINMKEQRFVSLFYQRAKLFDEIQGLNNTIKLYPTDIEIITNNLKTESKLQIQQVYQNTVTIYPVSQQ